jgi:hypothetical protein
MHVVVPCAMSRSCGSYTRVANARFQGGVHRAAHHGVEKRRADAAVHGAQRFAMSGRVCKLIVTSPNSISSMLRPISVPINAGLSVAAAASARGRTVQEVMVARTSLAPCSHAIGNVVA